MAHSSAAAPGAPGAGRLGPLRAIAQGQVVYFRELFATHHPVAWPAVFARDRWMSAVLNDAAVHFNFTFVGIATAVLSSIDLIFGSLNAVGPGERRYYGLFVVGLGLMELIGGLLLIRRSRVGRLLVVLACCGFFVEAGLALARFDQSFFSLVVFAVCTPAELWVIWFLCHPRARALFSTRPGPPRDRAGEVPGGGSPGGGSPL